MDSLLSWGGGRKRRGIRTPKHYDSIETTSNDARAPSETTAPLMHSAAPDLDTSDESDASMHARSVLPTSRPAKRLKATVAPKKIKGRTRAAKSVSAVGRKASGRHASPDEDVAPVPRRVSLVNNVLLLFHRLYTLRCCAVRNLALSGGAAWLVT